MSNSALFFSVIVVLFWSFIPIVGYLLAKLLKGNNELGNRFLFILGFAIALIEKSLFYFEVLTKEQVTIGTLLAFLLFFIVAYLPTNKKVTITI
jgi:hypothetical protein